MSITWELDHQKYFWNVLQSVLGCFCWINSTVLVCHLSSQLFLFIRSTSYGCPFWSASDYRLSSSAVSTADLYKTDRGRTPLSAPNCCEYVFVKSMYWSISELLVNDCCVHMRRTYVNTPTLRLFAIIINIVWRWY